MTKMSKNVEKIQKCQKMSKDVKNVIRCQKCQKMSKYVKKNQKKSKFHLYQKPIGRFFHFFFPFVNPQRNIRIRHFLSKLHTICNFFFKFVSIDHIFCLV